MKSYTFNTLSMLFYLLPGQLALKISKLLKLALPNGVFMMGENKNSKRIIF